MLSKLKQQQRNVKKTGIKIQRGEIQGHEYLTLIQTLIETLQITLIFKLYQS